MDEFDEKHKMVQKLLGMLKDHAAKEVGTGLEKPEGEGDMHGLEISHVEVLPDHEMDEVTPEHDVREEEDQPAMEKMAKGGFLSGLKKGALHKEMGIPEGENIPSKKLEKATNSDNELLRKRAQFAENAKKWHHADGGVIPPAEEGQPDISGAAQKEAEMPLNSRETKSDESEQEPHDRSYEDTESEPASMFASFLGKKKRK